MNSYHWLVGGVHMPRLYMRCGRLVYDRNGLLGKTAGPVDRPGTQGLLFTMLPAIQGPGFWESQGLSMDYYLASLASPSLEP